MLLIYVKLNLDIASSNTNAQGHVPTDAEITGRDGGECFYSFHATSFLQFTLLTPLCK